MDDYTLRELMTIAAARQINDGAIIFCGTGISMVAAMAAKHINAPNSTIFFETGAIDSVLEELPLAVADPRVMYYTAVNGGLIDSFGYMQNRKTGKQVVGVIGAAQIDCYGNLNSTVIGDYHKPKVRFSGSGGACDVASFVDNSIIFMQHEKRKFVNKVDYLTSPGWLDGGDSRERAGLPGKGPSKVITNMAIMGFDKVTRKMVLENYYPGITPEKILENMEFEVDISQASELSPPTRDEIKILREKCDPQGLIIGR
ncbi:CoA-transferase subunit beta [Desulforhopalus singaporensis]|uniref:Glutaconate CoA-transferase subunit B n=1 Tax=Desulforhopalus singaporensis TaxID=91360 RepID=A0A1H0TEM8_9BACT|nr:CoA-transferase [Desulforhopalus singaporensis]SDP51966.1 glutaconate CoA-transferase subunit B [Desulforhopalus singaporensis]